MNLRLTLTAALSAALLIPASASAHDGHHQRHHFRAVVLKGTVSSVNTDNGTLAVKVAKANRGGNALEGDTVTVKVVKGWVADTTGDGKRSIADVKDGDTVLVFTKRRFINANANTVSAAFVIDKTHPQSTSTASYRRAYNDGARDGNCDHR